LKKRVFPFEVEIEGGIFMAVFGWPKTLSWANFGTPKTTVPAAYATIAHTDAHIEIDISYVHAGATLDATSGDYKLKNVNVTVKTVATGTWVLKGVSKQSDQAAILKHEQGHYNIAGITARDVETALKALRNSDKGDLLNDVTTTADDVIASGQTEQETYDGSVADGGTDHGNDVTQQAAWNSKIAAAKSLADLP
jgi:Bacterial protein of unknown function (DUF922)